MTPTTRSNDRSVGMFTPISAPILRSVDPVKVSAFMNERENYKAEINSKKSEIPSLSVLSLKDSIDRNLLKNLLFMGKFDTIAPKATTDTLNDTQIETYLNSLLDHADKLYDPVLIDKALQGLRMPMEVHDPNARITEYCAEVFKRLDGIGYPKFKSDNPKQTVELLMRRIYPHPLKTEMTKILSVNEQLKKDVKQFINKLCAEATNCQSYTKYETRSAQGSSSAASTTSDKKKTNSTPSDNLPLCLWPKHRAQGMRHFLKDCKECPKHTKDELFENLRSERQNKGSAKRVAHFDLEDKESAEGRNDPESSGVLFSATFDDKFRHTICTDIGADTSIMDSTTVQQLESHDVSFTSTTLNTPVKFNMAATSPDGDYLHIECHQLITLNVDLHVRHGTALKLRNVRWHVTHQTVSEPLLGRPVLEALGLNTTKLLCAAAERFNGPIDLSSVADIAPDGSQVARVKDSVFHHDGGDDDSDADDRYYLDLGEDTEQEWEAALQKSLRTATKNGISKKGSVLLEKMLREFRDVLCIRLSGDKPANVAPLVVNLKPNSTPVRAKPRRYPPAKRDFMDRYVRNLLQLGFVKETTSAEWVSAPIIVPKKPPAYFRFAIDHKPINAATEKIFWPMPHIDSELADLLGCLFFAEIDFCSSYWQLPLAEICQAFFAIMTPRGVVQPTRTTQGGCNSAANFQQVVEPCFAALRDNLKAWLDDFILYSRSEEGHLQLLRSFLEICRERNLKISLPKTVFFAQEIKWCGRLIDGKGFSYDPANWEALKSTSLPINASELCQFVHGASWVSASIPLLHEAVSPLRDLLEIAYDKVASRKKSAIKKIRLDQIGWSAKHEEAFYTVRDMLCNAVKLSHRDPSKILCIHTDASDRFWAGVVTQCDENQLHKPISAQQHDPLAFLGSRFNPTQENWTTFEQEAFAIVETFKRLDYLFACDPCIRIFTDHRNLLFTFNPYAVEPSTPRQKVLKVLRWALFLSTFNYTIEHVAGDLNIFPDILTRWMQGYRSNRSSVLRVQHKIPFSGVPNSPFSDSFVWPSRDTLKRSQQKFPPAPNSKVDKIHDLFFVNGQIWVPPQDTDLKLKLLCISHAGEAGHRGITSTYDALSRAYYWDGMRQDTAEFVDKCILCILSKAGKKIPRPLSSTTHATLPGKILHFDYLYLGRSSDIEKYVLVLKDDLSSYCWIEPVSAADSANAASILTRWIRTFTAPEVWISDQGPHFINETLSSLASDYRILHQPTVAYSPWANGTVESLMRTILAALRALLFELKLAPQDWKEIIFLIQSVINSAGLERLGKDSSGHFRSPLQVMTGLQPNLPITRLTNSAPAFSPDKSADYIRANQILNISELQQSLDAMHKDVSVRVENNRKKSLAAHNKATNIVEPKFYVGDLVLYCRPGPSRHKLSFRWRGPMRITQIHGPVVYSIVDLHGNNPSRVHATRLIRYSSKLDNQEVPADVLALADHSTAQYETIDSFKDLQRDADGSIMVRTCWDGLPHESDWTWNSLQDLLEDVPDMLTSYLRANLAGSKSKIAKAALASLHIS